MAEDVIQSVGDRRYSIGENNVVDVVIGYGVESTDHGQMDA